MAESQTPNKTDRVLIAMWRNWAIGVGSLMVPMALALFIPLSWLPLIVLAEVYLITVLRRYSNMTVFTDCSMLLSIATRTLTLSAIIMLGINILCTDWLIVEKIHLEFYNREIPFLTSLIVFPCAVFFGLLSLYSGLSSKEFREYQQRNGYYAGDSIVGTLYYREARYQTTILVLVSIVMSAIEYWYYFARYINTNINDPDKFFFFYMPLIIYAVSLIFMWGRYETTRVLYHALENSMPDRANTTTLRFLVFNKDELLLNRDSEDKWDVPCETVYHGKQEFDYDRAFRIFSSLTDLNDFALRYCYTGEGYSENSYIVRYAAFVSDSERDTFDKDGTWFNPYMLDKALASNSVKPILTNELYRIHTITLTWKTYNREGKRLYPIKHYRPTFRFRDLKDWTVDYDDESWFSIAHNNEDRHFFRLRRFWERITGVFSKKQSVQ